MQHSDSERGERAMAETDLERPPGRASRATGPMRAGLNRCITRSKRSNAKLSNPKLSNALSPAAICLAAICAMAPTPTPAATPTFEAHERITAVAGAHALAQARAAAPRDAAVNVETAVLDSRLRLPQCPTTPVAFEPPGQRTGSNMTVGVRCTGTTAWSLYVPVRIEVLAEVLVLKAPANRGDQLTATHLGMESRNLATLGSGYMTTIEAVEGMVMRRAVRPGTAVTPDMLEPARLVRRGERVVIRSGRDNFLVQGEGEALADAAEGQRLRVRNTRSGRIIEGAVDADGTVVAGW